MLVLCLKSIVVNLTVLYKRQYAHLNTLILPVKFLALGESNQQKGGIISSEYGTQTEIGSKQSRDFQ